MGNLVNATAVPRNPDRSPNLVNYHQFIDTSIAPSVHALDRSTVSYCIKIAGVWYPLPTPIHPQWPMLPQILVVTEPSATTLGAPDDQFEQLDRLGSNQCESFISLPYPTASPTDDFSMYGVGVGSMSDNFNIPGSQPQPNYWSFGQDVVPDTEVDLPITTVAPVHNSSPTPANAAPTLGPNLCNQRFPCSNCSQTFKRDKDRIRHENNVHQLTIHLCPVVGCVKNLGPGYSRADKVTEHLWKAHGNLGYVKRT